MRPPPSNPALADLAHIACCGAPLLVIAVVAGALALTGAVAIVVAVLALVGAVGLWSRRRASCAAPDPSDPDARWHESRDAQSLGARADRG